MSDTDPAQQPCSYCNEAGEVCGAPIFWYTNEPTGQAAGWRHVDQPAVYRGSAHRATPVTGSNSSSGEDR